GSGDGRTGVPRPPGLPRALNEKAVHFALAMAADPAPDDASRASYETLLKTAISDQVDDGSWTSWPETRPPLFGKSHQRTTTMAALALLPAAGAGDAAAKGAFDRAVEWLARNGADDDPQPLALRLVLWRRLGRPAEECAALARSIRSRQNEDGG